MTKKEELLKLHKEVYNSIILKKKEDRTEEENKFVSWFIKKNEKITSLN